MSSAIKILSLDREAALSKVDALVKLSAELANAPHWTREIWMKTLEYGRSLMLAENDGELAGFVLCALAADEAEIESIAVSERFQRQGVGSALLNMAFNEMRQSGVEQVHLELRESNKKALAFYLSLGFKNVGCRRSYYSEPTEDAFLLSQKLD